MSATVFMTTCESSIFNLPNWEKVREDCGWEQKKINKGNFSHIFGGGRDAVMLGRKRVLIRPLFGRGEMWSSSGGLVLCVEDSTIM